MKIKRNRIPIARNKTVIRDAKLIVIATEGSKTEKIYFDALADTRILVHVIPSEDGRSSPKHIIDNMKKFRRKFDIGRNDECWIVIDRDAWPEEHLSLVAQECIKAKYGFAVRPRTHNCAAICGLMPV